MKFVFNVKSIVVEVDGDVPAAVVEVVEQIAKAALEQLAEFKAKELAKKA